MCPKVVQCHKSVILFCMLDGDFAQAQRLSAEMVIEFFNACACTCYR